MRKVCSTVLCDEQREIGFPIGYFCIVSRKGILGKTAQRLLGGLYETLRSFVRFVPSIRLFGLPSIAHFERRLLAERTRDGIESAHAKGKCLGRPPLDNARLDAAFKLIEAGTSPREAAKQLGLDRSTLYRELRKKNMVSA